MTKENWKFILVICVYAFLLFGISYLNEEVTKRGRQISELETKLASCQLNKEMITILKNDCYEEVDDCRKRNRALRKKLKKERRRKDEKSFNK